MHYRYSMLIAGLLSLISCGPEKPPSDTKESTRQPDTVVISTPIKKDSVPETEASKTPEVNSKLTELLRHPLDIKAYKTKKRGANSSTIRRRPYFYKPDTIGIFYEYMMFERIKGYRETETFTGLRLKTYIYGTEIGWYENVEEEFIGIKSRLIDHDLGPLNLVNKTTDELSTLYAIDFPKQDSLVVAANEGDVLILHYRPDSSGIDRIDWFNLLRTNLSVQSTNDLPEALKNFEERVK